MNTSQSDLNQGVKRLPTIPPSQQDVLITGASGVIGAEVTRRLSAAGYRVHVTARDAKKLDALREELSQKGLTLSEYQLDLTRSGDPERVIGEFIKRAANPYGFICNAGNLGNLGRFTSLEIDDWLEGIQDNFVAQARLLHAFSRAVETRKVEDARIIVLSGAGLGGNGSFEHLTSYSTSKAALTHLVEAMAQELVGANIRVNAVSPGQVSSGLTEAAIRAGVERAGNYAKTAEKCKASGGVSPDLAAQLIEFLLSPAAAGLTGRLFSARFDRETVAQNTADIAADPNLFRLRRIDNALFQSKS